VKTHSHVESDEWGQDGPKINSHESLEAIQKVLEESGPIIVEHRHYRGGRGPDYRIFDDFGEFQVWLDGTIAGDSIWVWDYGALCRDDNPVTRGKSPDEDGNVPLGGAY
jgi:hypothetical protein